MSVRRGARVGAWRARRMRALAELGVGQMGLDRSLSCMGLFRTSRVKYKVIGIGIASEQAGAELVDAFCAAMGAVPGTFGDREARALELGNELARR